MSVRPNHIGAIMRELSDLHESTFGPLRDAMAAIPAGEQIPTLDDIAAMLQPAAPAIQINIFINQEAESND